MVWEAFNFYIRGKIIAQASKKKKKLKKKNTDFKIKSRMKHFSDKLNQDICKFN